MRKSILKWTDCQYLHRSMNKAQESLMDFACRGFKEEGINNDFMAVVTLIELRDRLNQVLDRLPKKEVKDV